MAFQHYVTTRFFEIDRAGVLFFGHHFQYCHAAFEALLAEIFGDLEEAFASGRLAMPVVHSEAHFYQPIRWHDTLRIDVTLERLGNHSITFAYAIAHKDGQLAARARLTHACVNPGTGQSCPPPAELIAGLKKLGLLA